MPAISLLIPASTAPVALRSQNTPPTTSMKTIMPACFTKPWYMAENTCQVCGADSTCSYDSVPSAAVTYCPPGIIHVSTAHSTIRMAMMTYVLGSFLVSFMKAKVRKKPDFFEK